MPVPTDGAQRASSRRSIRLTILTMVAALVVGVGVAASPAPASATALKVVIVVGPVGSSTANYISSAKNYAAQARSYGAHGDRDLQPLRDVVQGQGRGAGCEPPDLSRSRQWLAQPVLLLPEVQQGRTRAQQDVRQRQLERQVLGRVLPRPLHPARAQCGRHPEPAVLRIGQFRVGLGESRPRRRPSSAPTTTALASCGPGRGPSSPRRSRTPGTRSRRSSRPTTRWTGS